ncbi:MAG: FAD-dependent thymidylate synthase, partial [Dehalococcoidia bacterium]|nr:FAD-dependent thymidylate synthase [Dehalococcoidia bacterium]
SAARSLLPIGTEAPIVVSANYRAWRHFFTMRATEAAELEIRAVALQVFDRLTLRAPNLLGDFTKHQLRDGTYALKTDYTKV